jgi:hypothetical protein
VFNGDVTQIATCLTHEFVIHVSDRRLTRPDTGEIVEEEATKAIQFGRQVIWGYTGLAALPGPHYYVKTDFWLLQRLKPDGRKSIEAIRVDATSAIARVRLKPERKRHAFVAAGWRMVDSQPKPALLVISNALASDLTWRPRAEGAFDVRGYELPADMPFALREFGQMFEARERASLERLVARALSRGAIAVARILANAVQAVAARNPAVGDRLLVGILPSGAVTTSGPGFSTPIAPVGTRRRDGPLTNPEFYYVPGAGSTDLLQYGPHWTDGNMQIANPMSAYGATADVMRSLPAPKGPPDRWGTPSGKTPP